MRSLIVLSLLLVMGAVEAFAQFPPRIEDHFWRRKVVNRIDLEEKINQPLIKRENDYYVDNTQYEQKEGLIMTLFNWLKETDDAVCYHPDSLNTALTYDDVMARIQKFEGSLEGEGDFDSEDDEGGFDDFEGDDFGGDGDGFEEDGDGDEWDFPDDAEFAGGSDDLGADASAFVGDFDPAPYESVIQFIEDRIFDKNRSEMVYDVQFLQIIWTDPGETLPEKVLCVFRYDEVLEVLERSQWKNRFNDAEYRTLREVFEMRLFHSYIIDVSGVGVNSLEEADHRRQQLVEFEHHLWSY
ncbi:MAG: hypothetical protein AAGI38_17930 [Bacteroidota bacterium]